MGGDYAGFYEFQYNLIKGSMVMPGAIIPLPDVYETIIRSVAVDAVRQIALNMELPEATKVYLPGRSDAVPMNDGIFGNCCDGANSVYFDPEERITISYDEVADENFSLSTSIYNNDNFPIFVNMEQYIDIYPITRYVDFRIDIEYQAPNVVIAQRWLDNQRMRYSSGEGELTLSLAYHYNIPKPILALLQGMYATIQKSQIPTDLTLEEWMCKYWTGPTTDMATLVGTHPSLSVYERAVDVVGWFDFYNTPETPERASDGSGAYTVTFSFICRYARPTHLKVKYPLLMNNCVIPKVFIPEDIYQNYQASNRKTTRLRGALEHEQRQQELQRLPYIQHPDIDDWQPTFSYQDRLTFFTGLLVICKDDLTTLMSVETLGRFKFSPYWLEYLKLEGDKAFAAGGPLEARLYRNDERVNVPVKFDTETMSLSVDLPLDPSGYYHVQLSLVTHFGAIKLENWKRLRYFPRVYWDIRMLFRGKTFPGEGINDLPLIGRGRDRDQPGEGYTDYTKGLAGTLPEGYIKWDDIYNTMEHQDLVNYRWSPIFTMLNFGIITERRKDL